MGLVKASELSSAAFSKVRRTGVITVDVAGGVGGWLSGSLVEIYGPESSGKTLLCLLAIIEAQKRYGEDSLLVDGEFAWDPRDEDSGLSRHVEWFKKLGGDPNKLDIYYPEYSESTYDFLLKITKDNKYAYVVIDSWQSMTPKVILDKDLSDKAEGAFGYAANVNSQFIKQLMPILHNSSTTFLIVNHLTEKMGVVFGDRETTPGGRALKFYSRQRVRMSPSKQSSTKTLIRGKFRKNKLAPPFGTFEFEIDFERGLNSALMIYMLAQEIGVLNRRGAKYEYQSYTITGRDNMLRAIEEDSLLRLSLESDILKNYSPAFEVEEDED